jgi:hypothetical protein
MAKINKEKEAALPQKRLKEVLSYSKENGVFTWIKKTHPSVSKIRVGQVAGTLNNGYVQINIDGFSYLAHRLVWLYVHGEFPQGEKEHYIDHINGKRADNRFENLKVSSLVNNQRNQKRNSVNTSGITGVYRVEVWNGSKTKLNGYWRANWYNKNGKGQWKDFSTLKLGEEVAKQTAIAHRAEQIRLLESEHGIKYSDRHGT